MTELQIESVGKIFEGLVIQDNYEQSQSITYLTQKLSELSANMAFVNNQMAITKKLLNNKKTKVYNNLYLMRREQEIYFSPMLAKDYVAAKCADEQYDYDLCERCSRTIVHTIDSIRTCISALKEELITSRYGQQIKN